MKKNSPRIFLIHNKLEKLALVGFKIHYQRHVNMGYAAKTGKAAINATFVGARPEAAARNSAYKILMRNCLSLCQHFFPFNELYTICFQLFQNRFIHTFFRGYLHAGNLYFTG